MHLPEFQRRDFCKAIVLGMALLSAPLTAVAQIPNSLDTSFLKEQPYRKLKQRVDLSSVTSESDLAVIRDGINPIMFFFANLGYITIPPQHMIKITTSAGAHRLRLPPVDSRRSNGRFASKEKFNWKVTGDSMITVTANFRDKHGKSTPYTDSYIFVKENGVWKFDRHD